MPMKNPSHPGEVFYWGVLEPLNISVSEAARALGVRRATLSAVVNAEQLFLPIWRFELKKRLDPKSISCCVFKRRMMPRRSAGGRKASKSNATSLRRREIVQCEQG
jgi:antitoxin HigA-1